MRKLFDVTQKWQASPPTTLLVAEKPVNAEGVIDFREVDYRAFAQAQGFKPIETIIMGEGGKLPSYMRPTNVPATAFLAEPHRKLVLVPMNKPAKGYDDIKLGYGVHYSPKAGKPIKEGTMVTHYAGEVRARNEQNLYAWQFGDASIDASKMGNLGRYLSYLPTAIELKFFVMPRSIRAQIAIANLSVHICMDGNSVVQPIIAKQTIEPGELLGLSYGVEYFLAMGILPIFYTKQGIAIDNPNVFFDKRRYMLFYLLNTMVPSNYCMINQINTDPKWIKVIEPWDEMTRLLENPSVNFIEFEKQFKQFFPVLKQAFDEGFNKVLAGVVGMDETLMAQHMSDIDLLLNMRLNDREIMRYIDDAFHHMFPRVPRNHPGMKTHTLDGVTVSVGLSDVAMFANETFNPGLKPGFLSSPK